MITTRSKPLQQETLALAKDQAKGQAPHPHPSTPDVQVSSSSSFSSVTDPTRMDVDSEDEARSMSQLFHEQRFHADKCEQREEHKEALAVWSRNLPQLSYDLEGRESSV